MTTPAEAEAGPVRGTVGGLPRLAGPVLLGLLAVTGSLLLVPPFSDLAYAQNDGLWFGDWAERDPRGSIVGHHPLFHVLVLAFLPLVRSLGIPHPGHVATRAVSGLALALILLLVARAGPSRRGAGPGFLLALALLSTRGFLVEAATGENVLLGVALALLPVLEACRPVPRRAMLVAGTVLALAARQDNILLLPAFAIAARGWPRGERLRRGLASLLAAAAATALIYLVCWRVAAPDQSLPDYLLHVALREGRSWAPEHGPRLADLPLHLAALGAAVTGVLPGLDTRTTYAAIGAAFVAALLAHGLLLRGRSPFPGRLLLILLLALAARIPFFLWMEPANWEWWLLPLALVALFAARLGAGEPRLGRPFRVAGTALLLLVALCVALLHGPGTWDARGTDLHEAARELISRAGPPGRAVYIAGNQGAHSALHVHGIPHDTSLSGAAPEVLLERLAELARTAPVNLALLVDRSARDGMPYSRTRFRDRYHAAFEDHEPPERWQLVGRRGLVMGILVEADPGGR
jgi:hypothetical protein